jgi:hypothetical protein
MAITISRAAVYFHFPAAIPPATVSAPIVIGSASDTRVTPGTSYTPSATCTAGLKGTTGHPFEFQLIQKGLNSSKADASCDHLGYLIWNHEDWEAQEVEEGQGGECYCCC